MDPAIEWHEPTGGARHGHAELLESWLGYSGQWDEFEFRPAEYLDARDHVVVMGTFRARARATAVEVPFVHVYRFRDGRVVWGREYVDTLKELRALEGSAA